jgi:hypothetical protein
MKKYKAWTILHDKEENKDTLNEFKKYMQHEMQHKKKRTLIFQGS